jgi:ABC-type branched-subunit amino acid transport system substrate-binding protein
MKTLFRNQSIKVSILFLLLSVLPSPCLGARGENGVTDHEILLGQSCALSGPAQAVGIGMRAGLNAYFMKINAEDNGIHGRKIRLVSLDDRYEPYLAINNTRELIDEKKVFMLIGEVGTPTAKAVVPMAEREGIPFFGPLSGAEFLRNPFKRYVINIRGSYYQETEKLVQYLVDIKKLKRIACFYQNDEYGQAGLTGVVNALERRSLQLVARDTYERNTQAVKSALITINRARPEAVIMIGAYKPCAEFIILAKEIGMTDTIFCNLSFVGSETFSSELGAKGEGCIISQVATFPWNSSIPLVQEYTAAMKRYQPSEDLGFVSLEGYMVGKLFGLAAARVKGDLTREKLIDMIDTTAHFDLGGIRLEFGPNDHQGMDDIFLTVIRHGRIEAL